MEDKMIQSGPCVVCGRTNYPLSMGGSAICPVCDCGGMIIIGDKKYINVDYLESYKDILTEVKE